MAIKNNFFKAVGLVLVFGALVPAMASAAVAPCPDYSGKIVKAGSALWLIQDGQRWGLVDREVATTWGKSVWSARTECVEAVPDLGGILSYRAGTRLLKQTGTSAIYASGPNGALHLIDSPEVAAHWYGRGWGSLVRAVPEAVFAKYHLAEPMTLEMALDRMVVRRSGQSQWFQVRNGELRRITGTVPAAIYNNTRVLSADLFNKIPMSASTITSAEILTTVTPATR